MSRKPREYYLSNFYHVMIQGDEKKFIFTKDKFKEKMIYLLKQNSIRNDIKLIAYCVMDNHTHVLVYCKELESLSKMMLQCNTSYGHYYSKKRGVVGHVFRERYRSEPIFSKAHLINCIKYIHENPKKARVISSCEEYVYSSYNEYLNKTGVFDKNLVELCDINSNEYLDIINGSSTNYIYIDELEEAMKVFDEIKQQFNIESITNEEIVKLYVELLRRCNVTKTQLAQLLNMKRIKLSRILCVYGYGKRKSGK